MSQVYYIVLVDGIPEAVSTMWSVADQRCKELSTAHRHAMILPTYGIDPAFKDEAEFMEEEDTEPNQEECVECNCQNGPTL